MSTRERYAHTLHGFDFQVLARFFSDIEFHFEHFKSQHWHPFNQVIHAITFPLMHYFAWALLLPHLPRFASYYILAVHVVQSTSFGLVFALFYSVAYLLLWLTASVDPLFSGSALDCSLAWLVAGVLQFFVGHRVLQGTFPKNEAVMNPLFRTFGVLYETIFGMAMLAHLSIAQILSQKDPQGAHSHSHAGPHGHSH